MDTPVKTPVKLTTTSAQRPIAIPPTARCIGCAARTIACKRTKSTKIPNPIKSMFQLFIFPFPFPYAVLHHLFSSAEMSVDNPIV